MSRSGAVDDETFLARLAGEGELLLRAFSRGDPAASVPGLEWDVRTVVTHTGAVHRWAADIVRRALTTNETGGSAAFWPSSMNDADLPLWFTEGLTAVVATLREAAADLSCYTFISRIAPRSFWIRRQAHETAIHRADVEAAAGGPVTAVDVPFAQDGLAELVGSFATEHPFATDRSGRLLLAASDGPSWRITFGGERNLVDSGDLAGTDADAVVRGTSDEIYRWSWNRPVCVDIAGDPDVIALWRRVRIR